MATEEDGVAYSIDEDGDEASEEEDNYEESNSFSSSSGYSSSSQYEQRSLVLHSPRQFQHLNQN